MHRDVVGFYCGIKSFGAGGDHIERWTIDDVLQNGGRVLIRVSAQRVRNRLKKSLSPTRLVLIPPSTDGECEDV